MSLYETKGEIAFENEFIETLTKNGWTYNKNLDEANPIDLENHFREILNKNNQSELNGVPITDEEMKEVMRFIGGMTPTEANGFLTNGYVSTITIRRENPELGSLDLHVFWRDDIAGGSMYYEVIKQAVRPGKEKDLKSPNRRFDVTLLFNGLPLIQVEEKKVDVQLKKASNQIVKYKFEGKYDGLYSMVQLFVALKEDASRYFANEKSADLFNDKFFFEWLDKENKPVRNWKQFTEEFLMIPMAHNIISNYTVVDGQVLKVLRPYQMHAVKAINEAFLKHQDGYVWHATGSGKTLTAYKTATLLQRNPNNQVIFLSDRKELDNQSGKNFVEFSADSDDNVFETNTTTELIKALNSAKTAVITTTINKMKIAVDRHNQQIADGKKGQLSKVMSKRIVFIVDEAHRSQFGEMQRVIRRAFPKQNWYGFTGTPIFEFNKTAQDQTTESQFGPELHRYNIGNALNDGAILPFNSEYVSLLQVKGGDDDYLDEDELDNSVYDGSGEGPEGYRSEVVNWIIKHWNQKSNNGKFNALFATSSIDQAMKFYHLFKKKQEDGSSTIKVAITYSIDENGTDNQEQREGLVEAMRDYSLRYTGTETAFNLDNIPAYVDDVAKRSARMEGAYKNISVDQEIDLTIVVARLLTGFDAQRLNTLYLDKLLEYQNLIQAYARTNRVFDKNKAQGNIVSFRRPNLMKERTQDAFEKYAGEGSYKKVFRPEFKDMQEQFAETISNLKHYVPTPEDANDLQQESQSDQIEFLARFRELAKDLQYIASYSEFDWNSQAKDYGITEEEFGYYQGAFENVKAWVTEENTESNEENEDEQLTFDFDDVVISQLVIDREYVLTLATKYLRNPQDSLAENEFNKAAEKLEKSGSNKEAENIRQFVQEEKQNGPVDDQYDANNRYLMRQSRRKQRAILDFTDEYGLDPELFRRLVTEYEATGEFRHESDLKKTADMEVAMENGHKYRNALDYKGSIGRKWQSFIKEDLAQYNVGGK